MGKDLLPSSGSGRNLVFVVVGLRASFLAGCPLEATLCSLQHEVPQSDHVLHESQQGSESLFL